MTDPLDVTPVAELEAIEAEAAKTDAALKEILAKIMT